MNAIIPIRVVFYNCFFISRMITREVIPILVFFLDACSPVHNIIDIFYYCYSSLGSVVTPGSLPSSFLLSFLIYEFTILSSVSFVVYYFLVQFMLYEIVFLQLGNSSEFC